MNKQGHRVVEKDRMREREFANALKMAGCYFSQR